MLHEGSGHDITHGARNCFAFRSGPFHLFQELAPEDVLDPRFFGKVQGGAWSIAVDPGGIVATFPPSCMRRTQRQLPRVSPAMRKAMLRLADKARWISKGVTTASSAPRKMRRGSGAVHARVRPQDEY